MCSITKKWAYPSQLFLMLSRKERCCLLTVHPLAERTFFHPILLGFDTQTGNRDTDFDQVSKSTELPFWERRELVQCGCSIGLDPCSYLL